MRSVLVAVLVPVLVVFLIGPYTFMPSLLEYAVARDVQARLGAERQPDVSLKSDPALEMLAGAFSGGHIVLKKTEIGGVRAERARIDLDPFDINVWDSMWSGHVVDREPLSGEIRVEVSEEEVSRLVKVGSDMPVSDVELKEDGMVVKSEVSAFGAQFPVSVDGDLGLSDGSLVFEPQSLEAAGIPVPQELSDKLLAGAKFDYSLDRLPYETRITGVRAEGGQVLLTGRVPSIPLGVYPGG